MHHRTGLQCIFTPVHSLFQVIKLEEQPKILHNRFQGHQSASRLVDRSLPSTTGVALLSLFSKPLSFVWVLCPGHSCKPSENTVSFSRTFWTLIIFIPRLKTGKKFQLPKHDQNSQIMYKLQWHKWYISDVLRNVFASTHSVNEI